MQTNQKIFCERQRRRPIKWFIFNFIIFICVQVPDHAIVTSSVVDTGTCVCSVIRCGVITWHFKVRVFIFSWIMWRVTGALQKMMFWPIKVNSNGLIDQSKSPWTFLTSQDLGWGTHPSPVRIWTWDGVPPLPIRKTEGVLDTRWAVCRLCSRRRTFLFLLHKQSFHNKQLGKREGTCTMELL